MGRKAAPFAVILILAILLAPALIGLPLAAWAYPWRKPVVRPYIWFIAAFLAPLVILFLLQSLFTLPPGTCAERAINNLPLLVAMTSVAMALGLIVKARGYRLFITGIAVAICPPTALWSLVTVMSMAGCWI